MMNIGTTLPQSSAGNSKNLWIDESNRVAWAEACHRDISSWLSVIVGDEAGDAQFARNLRIEVETPSKKIAERAFKRNRTLTGKIRFRWFDQEEVLCVPMSFHGVFLFRREDSAHPLVSVWPSWLAERNAFRIVLPTDERKREAGAKEWRLGLPDGSWVGAPLKMPSELTEAEEKRLCRKHAVYVGLPEAPDWLSSVLSIYGPGNFGKKRENQQLQQSIWQSIQKYILKDGRKDRELPAATDEDDLEHKMLMTFPVWLRQRVSWGLLQALLPVAQKRGKESTNIADEQAESPETRRRIASILKGQEEGDSNLAGTVRTMLWSSLCSLGAKVQFSLNNYRSDEKTDYIDPINPLDLAARITRVRRLPLASRFLEEKPEEFRQNHPSFAGRLCPVDSPESGMVGLTLHLAAGASVDLDGCIHPAENDGGKLGFGAGLVPFFCHNDGARNMMGAKNLRQAIPVHGVETPAVLTGGEAAVTEFVEPLLDLGICPRAVDGDGRLRLGRDLLVAYMPWYGMNMEDAVVISESAAGALGCDNLRKPPIRKPIPVDWVPTSPERPKDYPELDDKGLIKAGTKVHPGMALACFAFKGKKGEEQRIITYKDRTPAVVKRIKFHRKTDWMTGSLEIELELPIPARPGDKLMGRHGNKGVIGTILSDEKMPKLPNTENLNGLRGKPIDIILNPHGVVGRMNLGQLLETHVGWVLHCGANAGDLLKDGQETDEHFATAFADSLDHDKVQAALAKTGLDRYGRVKLQLPNGGETAAPVVVGFQHIVRLRHIPELKSQARRGGENAFYSARTGQAIHGRKFGGGQRLGEMEIWALEGHQADAILGEMLGIKSSADVIKTGEATAPFGYTGYSRVLKDWLFAMGIDLAVRADRVEFGLPGGDTILERVGKQNVVTVPGGIQSRVTASFKCVHGTKHKPCPHQLLDGEKIAFRLPSKGSQPSLNLADVLEHLHLEPSGKLHMGKKCCHLPLRDTHTGKSAGEMEFNLTTEGDAVKGVGKFLVSSPAATSEDLASLASEFGQPAWAEKREPAERYLNGIELHLYGRFGKGTTRGGGNLSGDAVIKQFLEADPTQWLKSNKHRQDGNRHVVDLTIICPVHVGKAFTGQKPFGEKFTSEPGGLLDPHIFGNYTTAFRSSHRWGYIELPFAVDFPIHALLTKSKDEKQQKAAVKSFEKKLKDEGVAAVVIPQVQVIPVLPIRYRMPFRVRGRVISNDLDLHGYIPVLQACAAYQRKSTPQNEAWLKGQVARLFRKLAAALDTKDGLIRRDGLGRRVDRSARLVITPNPELPWDVAGIPTPVLIELMGDLVHAWKDKVESKPASKLPPISSDAWTKLADNAQVFDDARTLLEAYLKANPDFVVLLNRQPSLHRDSFQAFKPRPLPREAGDVIQLNPLACKGFAADFDGDEMVVHVPVSEAAQAEAQRMLPSANLHSLATTPDEGENVLAHFDQDFVMGTWLLGKADPLHLRQNFLGALPEGSIKSLAEDWAAFPTKSDGGKLMAEIASKAFSEAAGIIWSWMQVALRACTHAGVSFGFYELREMAHGIAGQVQRTCDKQVEQIRAGYQADGDYNAALEELACNAVKEKATSGLLGEPGFGFAAIAHSGAKGKPEQLRQILAARGLLHPGKLGCDPFSEGGWARFFVPQSLCAGLDFESSFWAAMNARTSMVDKKLGTGYGGGLTRSMVFALWPCRITVEDCCSTELRRSPLTCSEKDGICARCYGELPHDKNLPPLGFPIGMIAAQSIGERGTQLSMQSFHAGKKAIDIHEARDAIKTPKKAGIDSYEDFVEYLKKANAYRKLLDRHFEVIWRALSQQRGKTMREVILSQDSLTLIAFRHNPAQILHTVLAAPSLPRNSAIARLLTGGAPQQSSTPETK